MYLMFSLAITLLAPILLALAPFILSRLGFYRVLPAIPRWPSLPGFQPVSAVRNYGQMAKSTHLPRLQQSFILVGSFLFGFLALGAFPGASLDAVKSCRDGALLGTGLGFLILAIYPVLRTVVIYRQSAVDLAEFGISGVWHGRAEPSFRERVKRGIVSILRPDAPLESGSDLEAFGSGDQGVNEHFVKEVVRTIEIGKQFDAISATGVELIDLLARNPEEPLAGPKEALRGARVRLLLLPPRGHLKDPDDPTLSCAELSLVRNECSAEEHWRLLKHALVVSKHWLDHYGVDFRIRFLETRPAFTCLMAGTRIWFHSWPNPQQVWMELQDHIGSHGLAMALRDHFTNQWAISSPELDIPLAGPTGTAVIRNGIEVPRANSSLTLVEEEHDENVVHEA